MGKSIEKRLEDLLNDLVVRKGGLTYKWVSPGQRGVMDRIVIMPGNRIYFVEIKDEGLEMEPLQEWQAKRIRALGGKVYIVNSYESLNIFINEI